MIVCHPSVTPARDTALTMTHMVPIFFKLKISFTPAFLLWVREGSGWSWLTCWWFLWIGPGCDSAEGMGTLPLTKKVPGQGCHGHPSLYQVPAAQGICLPKVTSTSPSLSFSYLHGRTQMLSRPGPLLHTVLMWNYLHNFILSPLCHLIME
jgi:hypothetical protein